MAIHDDNWTKEFAKDDDMKMTVGDRMMHGAMGLVLLTLLASPWLPHSVARHLQELLIGGAVVSAGFFTGYFFYKAFKGRW